jgi:hypothetical protein
MTATPNTNSQEEQLFLATLQECLQADNEKRTAAEVQIFNLSIKISKFNFLFSKFIKI